MSVVRVLQHPDPILYRMSSVIKVIDQNLKNILINMHDTVSVHNGIGIAAPQIGENIRVFIMKINDDFYKIINPEILEKSEESIIMQEGCLSIPNTRINVKRSKNIKTRFLNIHNQKKEHVFCDLEAVCFQHELDHLNGITILMHKHEDDRLVTPRKNTINVHSNVHDNIIPNTQT